MSDGLKFSDSARAAKFAHWERAGVEPVTTDLDSGGCSVVGPSVQERRLAEEWLEIKLAEKVAALKRFRREDPPPTGVKGMALGLLERVWEIVTFR
jgi:hypothetical protein